MLPLQRKNKNSQNFKKNFRKNLNNLKVLLRNYKMIKIKWNNSKNYHHKR